MPNLAAIAKDYVIFVFSGRIDLGPAWIIGIMVAATTLYCLAKILKAYLNRFK